MQSAAPKIVDPSIADVAYLGPDRREKLDVYLPPAEFARPVPAVLLIHGGGWGMSHKSADREKNIGTILSAAGYAVFSIDYLLNTRDPETKTPTRVVWPQNFFDCKSALRFMRKEAQQFGVDPERIAAMGGSAGGHLSMLLGATAHSAELNRGGLYTDQRNDLRCIINFYGIHDVREKKWAVHFAGSTPEETAANTTAASPLTHFDHHTPPILIAHGTADKIVSVEVSHDLVRVLKEKKIEHEYIEVPGAPHTFHLQPKEMDLREPVLAFLKKHLGR
jgi:acetyl esterase/lipase